eukprot:SAG11_NODE_19078_length_474_cov_3.178667_1_plen_126_part_01
MRPASPPPAPMLWLYDCVSAFLRLYVFLRFSVFFLCEFLCVSMIYAQGVVSVFVPVSRLGMYVIPCFPLCLCVSVYFGVSVRLCFRISMFRVDIEAGVRGEGLSSREGRGGGGGGHRRSTGRSANP